MNQVRLRDVAATAGSSVTTVSLVLNGKAEKVRISPATQARIRATARQLGYQPNQSARDIVLRKPYAGIRKPDATTAPANPPPVGNIPDIGQQQRQVGVVLSPKTSPETLSLIPGLIPELAAAGYQVVITKRTLPRPQSPEIGSSSFLGNVPAGFCAAPPLTPWSRRSPAKRLRAPLNETAR